MNILRTFIAMISMVTYTQSAMQNVSEDISAPENKLTTALMNIVQTKPKNPEFFKREVNALLHYNADPNSQNPKNGYTALMLAARSRNLAAVEMLAPKTNLYLRSTRSFDGTKVKRQTVFDQLDEEMLNAMNNFKLFSSISAASDEVLKHVDPKVAQRQQLIKATLDDCHLVKDVIFEIIEYDSPGIIIKR